MKKILSIILVLMMMISISSLALADEEAEGETEETIDSETLEETEIMNCSHGAEIRLLQLEKAITTNLLKGNMIVDVLAGLDYNTTGLVSLLDELELVLGQVQDADPEANNSVEVFVGLKIDSKNLTKQFRDTLKDLLSDVKYKEIKEQIRENLSDELQNYNKRIRNLIKQFNRNQAHKLYGMIGEGNNSFVNQYMNGTMNLTQLKLQLHKMVNMKTKARQKEIFAQMKKVKIQNKANVTQHLLQIQNNFEQKTQERLQERLEKANEAGNTQLQEHIQSKIQNYQSSPGGPQNAINGGGSGKGNGKGN